jgi:DNA-binding IclR family transcriptional regulator
MPEEEAAARLPQRLPRLTAKTLASRTELQAELAQVRRDGVAFDREEHTDGICAVGAVVRDPGGTAAAISVPVPVQRFEGREAQLANAVRDAAAAASRLLGG